MGRKKNWTEREEKILMEFYQEYGPRYVSKIINRSVNQITAKAQHMGLCKPKKKTDGPKETYNPIKIKLDLEKILFERKCPKCGQNLTYLIDQNFGPSETFELKCTAHQFFISYEEAIKFLEEKIAGGEHPPAIKYSALSFLLQLKAHEKKFAPQYWYGFHKQQEIAA